MDRKSGYSVGTHFSRKSTDQPSSSDAVRYAHFEQDVVELMRTYRLFEYKADTERMLEEKQEFFKNLDAINILENIKQAKKETTRLSAENYLFRTFLTNNDKMLLLGQGALYMTRESIIKSLKRRIREDQDQDQDQEEDGILRLDRRSVASHRSVTSHRSAVSRRSVASRQSRSLLHGTTISRSEKVERKLNYMTKAALAHRERMTVERRITRYEKEAKETLETTRAKIFELDMRRREVYLTEDNFLMNFARSPENLKFLRIATEHQLSSRFSKFISGISKNAKSFKCTMNLTVNTLMNHSHELYNSIIAHTDLHKTLTEPDHEVLEIRLREMTDEYHRKQKISSEYQHKTLLRSTQLIKESRKFDDDEVQYTQLMKQMKSLTLSKEHMRKELKYYKKSNSETILKIANLKNQLQKFHAPSVADYMRIKFSYEKLLKDKKVLLRQTNLLKLQKAKRHHNQEVAL